MRISFALTLLCFFYASPAQVSKDEGTAAPYIQCGDQSPENRQLTTSARLSISGQDSHSDKSTQYRCPPCGCSSDKLALSTPGYCPSCCMPLVPVNEGVAEQVDQWISPYLQDGMLGILYPKLIYPVFAVGILISLVFLFSGLRGSSMNIFLSAIILVLSLYGFKHQLYGVRYGLTSNYRSLFTPISLILMLGPLVFFYVKSTVAPPFAWRKKYWLHLLPAGLAFVFYALLGLSPDGIHQAFMTSRYEITFSHLEQLLTVSLGIGYLAAAYKLFACWKKDHSDGDPKRSRWLSRFFLGMGLLFSCWGILIFLNFWLFDMGVATVTYNPLWVLMSLLLMWLASEVVLQPKFFLIPKPNGHSNGYHTLPEEELRRYRQKLDQVFDRQKIYTDPDLTLDKLAAAMDINPKSLSMLLNQVIGKKFYDLVNQYRVEEVKHLLLNPDYQHFTIEAIAREAGFKSKSTFNATFKKLTNMTPRAFMKQ